MMAEARSSVDEAAKGFWKENPVFV